MECIAKDRMWVVRLKCRTGYITLTQKVKEWWGDQREGGRTALERKWRQCE